MLLELAGHAGDLVSELFAESDEISRSPFDSGIGHGYSRGLYLEISPRRSKA